jgi:16S rRNA (guanine1207-N2)-methyltransferase
MVEKTWDYEKPYIFQADLAGSTFQIYSKPGFPSWDRITPAQFLIAERVDFKNTQDLLMYNIGHGVAAAAVTYKLPANRKLYLVEPHYNALNCAIETLVVNGVQNYFPISSGFLPNELNSCIDTTVIDIPKGRKLLRRWLIETYEVLKPSGKLYLVGANNQGIQSAIKDATDLFGRPILLGYKKGNRLARFVKTEKSISLPGWSMEPGVARGSWYTFNFENEGNITTIHSLPGVFSYECIDEGSQFLIQNLPYCQNEKVLDIGCGYGILGITLALKAKSEGKEIHVDLLDNNFLAVASSQKNIQYHHIPGTSAFPSDLLSAKANQTYQLIVSNPPFHAGTETDYSITSAMVRQASQALVSEGQLYIVANHFLRYDQLMKPFFQSVKIIARNNKYHVIVGKK